MGGWGAFLALGRGRQFLLPLDHPSLIGDSVAFVVRFSQTRNLWCEAKTCRTCWRLLFQAGFTPNALWCFHIG